MVTVEELGRQTAAALNHLRTEIDAAYERGFEDGSSGGCAGVIVGAIVGAATTALGFWVYLS